MIRGLRSLPLPRLVNGYLENPILLPMEGKNSSHTGLIMGMTHEYPQNA